MLKYCALAFAALSVACISTPPFPSIRPLKWHEKILANEIIREANKSPKKDYYLKKLQVALSTPEVSKEAISSDMSTNMELGVLGAEMNTVNSAIRANVSVSEYVSREEVYENSKKRHWVKYHPDGDDSYYYVAKDDPTDILLHIRIHLVGDEQGTKIIAAQEDNIEKWAGLPGFNVNIEFVAFEAEDTFEIKVDHSEWPNSANWSAGDYFVFAHELYHSFGLPDEYNMIDSHAGNKYLTIGRRLEAFWAQMRANVPDDAENGIMADEHRKPLQRHVCTAVGLGKECVQARVNKFGNTPK